MVYKTIIKHVEKNLSLTKWYFLKMKTALLFLSMNSWLIANDTFLLLMRPDNPLD